jgi:hypothetical protein
MARRPALSAPGPARRPPAAGALVAAALRPLPLALVAVMLVALVTVQWAAAAVLPVWALLVAVGTVERLAADPSPPELTPASGRLAVAPALATRVERALEAERAVLHELDALPHEPSGLRTQVERLRIDLLAAVERAGRVDDYLAGVDLDDLRAREAACRADPRRAQAADALAEQLRVAEVLRERRAALEDEMEQVEIGLGVVRGRLVAIRAGAAVQGSLGEDVAALRGQVRAVAEGFSEAYGHNDPH